MPENVFTSRLKNNLMITLSEDEWKLILDRIAVADKKGFSDYSKFEMDIIQGFPSYATMVNYTDVAERKPDNILTEILRQVFREYKTPEDYIGSLVSSNRGKTGSINPKMIKDSFKKYDQVMSDEEFEKVLDLLQPNRKFKKDIKMYVADLSEAIGKELKPLVNEIAGRLLNGFDRGMDPLGVKIAKSGKVKKGKSIAILDLYNMLKEYDQSLTENQCRILIRHFDEFRYTHEDTIKFDEFISSCYKRFESFNLRPPERVKDFFSSIPQTISTDGGTTVGFKIDQIGEGTNSAPGLGNFLDQYLLRMKQKLRILTKKDAESAFKRMDTNYNDRVSQTEFDKMAKQFLPEVSESVRKQIYTKVNPTGNNEFDLTSFLKVFIQDVPQWEDRMELLKDKTEPYETFLQDINQEMETKRTNLHIMFGDNEEVSVDKVKEKLKMDLGVRDPSNRLTGLLQLFTITRGWSENIILEEFKTILNRYKKKQFNFSEIIESRSPTTGGNILNSPQSKWDRQDKSKIDQLIETIRKSIISKPEHAVYTLFNHVDKDKDQIIEFKEFFRLLKHFDKNLTEKEGLQIFKRVDTDRSDFISKDEFIDFFAMRGYVENQTILGNLYGKEERFNNILDDLNKGIINNRLTPEKVFDSRTIKINKKDFLELLQTLNINPRSYPNYDDFLKAIEHRDARDTVDISKLRIMMDKHYKENKSSLTKDMSSQTEVFLYDLLYHCNYDIEHVISIYDPDGNGSIRKPEFIIYSKDRLKGYENSDLGQIFDSLSDNQRELTKIKLQIRLIATNQKYNRQSSQTNMSALNDSMDSPRAGNFDKFHNRGLHFNNFEERADNSMAGDRGSPMSPGGRINKIITRPGASAEEKKQAEVEAIYARLRDMLDYQGEILVAELKKQDTKNTNKLHEHYIWEVLGDLNARKQDFTERERTLLFEDVAKSDGLHFYLDFVRRLFPTKQLVNIQNVGDLIDELLKEQQMRKETLADLWKEVAEGNIESEVSDVQFNKFLSSRGILLAVETINYIFGQFDTSKNFKIDKEEFMAPFLKDGCEKGGKLARNVKNYLLGIKTTAEVEFKRFLNKQDVITFKEFAEAMDKLKVPIKYIEIEVLFQFLDRDISGELSLEEITKRLDTELVVPKEEVSHHLVRKAMYKQIKSKYHSFQHFFDTFDSNGKKFWKISDFVNMLKELNVPFTDIPKDVRPLYEQIDGDMTLHVTVQKLTAFYDESNILILFPVILKFRQMFLNYMEQHKYPTYFIISRNCMSGDELNLSEFKELLKSIGMIDVTDEENELIFNELDYEGNKTVSAAEVRRMLAGGIVDVFQLVDRIQSMIFSCNMEATAAFLQANESKDQGLSYQEFTKLLNLLNIYPSVIEIEEVFTFVCSTRNSLISLTDFNRVFDSYKKVNPFTHNPKYFEDLSNEAKEYYKNRYSSLAKQFKKGNITAYNKDRDQMLITRLPANRNDYPNPKADEPKGFFNVQKVDSGDRSTHGFVSRQDHADIGRVDESQITDNDIKLVVKIQTRTRGSDEELSQLFLSNSSSKSLDTVSQEDFEKLVKQLGIIFVQEQPETVFKRILTYGPENHDRIKFPVFRSYYQKVSDYIQNAKGTGLNLRSIAGPKITQILTLNRKLPQEFFDSFKSSVPHSILLHEFIKMIKGLELEIRPNEDDINTLFKFLNKAGTGYLSFEEFLGVFEDSEKLIREIAEGRETGILSNVGIHCRRMGLETCLRQLSDMDRNMTNELSDQEFMNFFKKNNLNYPREDFAILCTLFKGKNYGTINYIDFLVKINLMDRVTAERYLNKTTERQDNSVLHEFASFLELFCRNNNIEIFNIFDNYDPNGSGYMLFDQFKRLAGSIKSEHIYGSVEIENLFDLIDGNQSGKVTKEEFYKVVLPQHYASMMQNRYFKHNNDFDQINDALRSQRKQNLKAFFSTSKDCVIFETFMKSATMLNYDMRSQGLFDLMKSFEDQEHANSVNITKVCYGLLVTRAAG